MIRGLNQARKWNARKMKRVREERSSPIRRPSYHSRQNPVQRGYGGYYADGGGEYLDRELENELETDFARFLDQQYEKEEEEQRLMLVAAEEKKRAAELEKKKRIEERAVKEHMAKMRKAEAEATKKREALRKKLEERGGLTQEQLDMIVDEALPKSIANDAFFVRNDESSEASKNERATSRDIKSDKETTQKMSKWRYVLP